MLRDTVVTDMENNWNCVCDGIAGCLRTPEGGKKCLVVKEGKSTHARLLTVREAARLMGAPDTFKLPGSYNDGYKAMGDAVAALGSAVYWRTFDKNCGGSLQ